MIGFWKKNSLWMDTTTTTTRHLAWKMQTKTKLQKEKKGEIIHWMRNTHTNIFKLQVKPNKINQSQVNGFTIHHCCWLHFFFFFFHRASALKFFVLSFLRLCIHTHTHTHTTRCNIYVKSIGNSSVALWFISKAFIQIFHSFFPVCLEIAIFVVFEVPWHVIKNSIWVSLWFSRQKYIFTKKNDWILSSQCINVYTKYTLYI